MPNKTFYVAEDDLPLFERAQNLANGNLSAAISSGVRYFVELQEGIMEGHREITLTVGALGLQRAKQFVGVKIVTWEPSVRTQRFEVFAVYRTLGNRLAVHTRRIVNVDSFTEWQSLGNRSEDPGGVWNELSEATLDIYDDVNHLTAHVPSEVALRVRSAIDRPDIEALDI